ncbi:MAG: DnaA N-terminal domain-containing protein, partial [Chlamydiales bacterium]
MQAWETFLREHEERLGKEVVKQWLRPLQVARFDAGNLYLLAQNFFQISWFKEHIQPYIK